MLSIPDMALLGAAALLLFGPEQLPRVARKAGNFMREVQNTSQSFIREMERAADVQDAHDVAKSSPVHDAYPYEDPVTHDHTPYEIEHYPDAPLATNGAHERAVLEPPAPDLERPLGHPADAAGDVHHAGGAAGEASPADAHGGGAAERPGGLP